MRQRLVSQPRLLMLVAMMLFVGSFLPADTATSIASAPRHIVESVTGWMTRPLLDAATWARTSGQDADLPQREVLAENNEQLLQYNRKLEDQLRLLSQQMQDLTKMRQVPTIANSQAALIPAGVTAYFSGAAPGLTINIGDRHSTRVGQAVVAGTNLVGRVVAVGPNNATVGLISSPGTLLDVRVIPASVGAAPRETVLQIQPEEDGELFVAEGAHTDRIQVGDLAHLRLADNVLANEFRWPDEAAGMVVGKVVKIEKHPDDPALRTLVWIKPRLSLKRLTRVVVIAPATSP